MLQKEIDKRAKEIKTDAYSMSIGEIASLYKDGEIDIHPDFQRIYRWSPTQKSKLIESILLGIPIPSIFVAQNEKGIWDVIDGLQRLSTIFEFMGILRDSKDEIIPPLALEATKYLPSLKGMFWENKDESISLDQTQRLLIKRAKLDIQIIKRESDKDAKYELFQRLNTGGSKLSEQEVRNCLLVMLDKEKFNWLKKISNNKDFLECISITERAINECYNDELALRFIIYRHTPVIEITRSSEINTLITEKMIELIENTKFDFIQEENIFQETFKKLNSILADDSFRKYNDSENKFKGPFSISAYEAIIPGLSENIKKYTDSKNNELISKIKSLWGNKIFINNSGAGLRAADRVKELFPLSKKHFTT